MANGYEYNAGTNILTVTGGTSGSPRNFADMYAEDVANGWGVVHQLNAYQYQIDCRVVIGDGSTSTYFQDKNKQITLQGLSYNWTYYWNIQNNATCILGQLDDETNKATSKGCQINLASNYNGYFKVSAIYGCSVLLTGNTAYLYASNQWNCQYISSTSQRLQPGNPDYMYNTINICSSITPSASCQFNNISIINGLLSVTAANVVGTNIVFINSAIQPSNRNTLNLINPALINTTITCNAYWGGTVYLKASIDIHITDKDGNPISGATVNLYDKDDNPVWTEGSVTTNVDGKITQQQAIYTRYWATGTVDGGDGVTYNESKTPHTLKITKTGYQDYQDVITIDRPMDLEVAMLAPLGGSGSGAGPAPTCLGLVPLGIKQVAI